MLVASFSTGVIGPYMTLGQNAVHADTFELAWLNRGSVAAKVGGESWLQTTSYLALIAPGCPHSSWTLEEEIDSGILHLYRVHLTLPMESRLIPISRETRTVLDEFPTHAANRHGLEPLARRLLAVLLDAPRTAEGGADERVLRALIHIVEDPAAPHTLDALARVAGVSVYHFTRLFRDALGESPMRYVRSRRVRLAARLLETTDRSVTEIAHTTGFSSAGRLSEAFTELMGCPPSAFRSRDAMPRDAMPREQESERLPQLP